MKIVVTLLMIVFFTNCRSKSDRDAIMEVNTTIDDSTKHIGNKNNVNDSIQVKTEFISKDLYSLSVESYFYNTEADYENSPLNKIVQQQILKFSHNDTIIKSCNFPVKKINALGIRIKSIQVQENNLYKICIIIGKEDWLYCVQGSGVTDSQTEYYGLFTKQGKQVWYSYTSYQNRHKVQQEIPDEGFGDIDKIFFEYGISEQEFNKPINCKEIPLY